MKLTPPQYKLFSRFFEDLAKTVALSAVVGFFLPSVLPAALPSTPLQFVWGLLFSLTFLVIAVILTENGER